MLTSAGAVRLYSVLVLSPFALALVLTAVAGSGWFALPLLALPWGWRLCRALARTPSGPAQNALLFRTVMLEVAFGVLLAVGAVLARF